jgi:hypothetical protein
MSGAYKYLKVVELIDNHINEAEEKAKKSLERHKYMMFGYWKAIAVHLRKIRRELLKIT